MDPITILENSPLFGGLQAEELRQIASLASTRDLAKGTTVFMQGDAGDALYGLASGKVLIAISGADGKEFSLTVMEDGDVFGEIALLDGGERTASARTLSPCRLLVIERASVLDLLTRNPKITINLLQLLCQRIRWSSQLIEEFSLMPVEGRLARRLLTLAELMGRTSSEGVKLTISQGELAQFLGISRQIVNQYLQEWKESGWIDLARGRVIIRDWDAVHQVCLRH